MPLHPSIVTHAKLCYSPGMNALKNTPPRLVLMISVAAILACQLPAMNVLPTATPEPSPTPAPTAIPTPAYYLDPDRIWVGLDGPANVMMTISMDGETDLVSIPLNEGQQASDLAASRDGRYLAYLVWNASREQHGIASWNLSGPNAKLVAKPEPGYRIVGLYVADGASALVYVQVEEGILPGEADWRVDSTPIDGGDSTLLVDRSTLDDLYPPTLFAWPDDGLLLLNASAPDGSSQGIYAFNPENGQSSQILPPVDARIVAPTLSPDSSKIAYLTLDTSLPDIVSELVTTNVVRIYDLRLDETTTIAPGEGQAIYGVRWLPDGKRVLLDMVDLSADDVGVTAQHWLLVPIDQTEFATDNLPDTPRGEFLFDYEPLSEGVVYTVRPVDDKWNMYIIPDVAAEESAPHVIVLDDLAQDNSAPLIVRIP
jgi:dipeptidyl aminopeptidase/acylaminoacyl peptidase